MSIVEGTMADEGLKIQELLDATGVNLHQLHIKTGIKYQTLLRYRDNETESVKIEHIRLICNALKRDANSLFGIGKPSKLK